MGRTEGNRIMTMKRICTVVFLIGAFFTFKNVPVKTLIDIAIITCVMVLFQLTQVFRK